jgi:hypothetical protein
MIRVQVIAASMSPAADNPVVVPNREHDEEKWDKWSKLETGSSSWL